MILKYRFNSFRDSFHLRILAGEFHFWGLKSCEMSRISPKLRENTPISLDFVENKIELCDIS